MNLLDHMDWMTEDLIINEWTELLKCTTDDCKFCWRSYAFYQPFSSLSNINYDISSPIFPYYKDLLVCITLFMLQLLIELNLLHKLQNLIIV